MRRRSIRCLALGVIFFGVVGVCPAQEVVKRGDLQILIKRIGEEIHTLGEDVAASPKKSAGMNALVEQARELSRSITDFQKTLGPKTEAFRVRQVYSGMDASWHHLSTALLKAGSVSPAVEQAMRQTAETDLAIHRILRRHETIVYYGLTGPAEGVAEVRRLAQAMADRAEALAFVARKEVPDPKGGRLMAEALDMVQAAETYREALKLDGAIDATTRNGFRPVVALSDGFANEFAGVKGAPRTLAAWRAYKSAELLVDQMLAVPIASAVVQQPRQPEGPSAVDLADSLVRQASRFADLFGPTGNGINEGPQLLDDARQLQILSARFRDQAIRNTNPRLLAFEFRDLDIVWLRLVRRISRLGRDEPAMGAVVVNQMSDTVAELHRMLGMPGFAMPFGEYP